MEGQLGLALPSGRLLRVHTVAKQCGVSPRTVRNWAESGSLPGHKRGPKLWSFYEEDVLAFLDLNQRGAGEFSDTRCYADLAAVRLKSADRQELTGPLCSWSSSTSGGLRPTKPKTLILGCAPFLGASTTQDSVDMLCFFSVCRTICAISADQERRAVVEFSIDRASPARLGVQTGYDCLWKQYASTLTFCPGSLDMLASDTISPYLLQTVRELLPRLAGQIRISDKPSTVSATVDGIPLRGYIVSAEKPFTPRFLIGD